MAESARFFLFVIAAASAAAEPWSFHHKPAPTSAGVSSASSRRSRGCHPPFLPFASRRAKTGDHAQPPPHQQPSNQGLRRSPPAALRKIVAASLRGGAASPRGFSSAAGPGKRSMMDGGGSASEEDDSEVDLEALLQSVSNADVDESPLDFGELSELGDFSGLGRLDFSFDDEDDRFADGVLRDGSELPSDEEEEDVEEVDGKGVTRGRRVNHGGAVDGTAGAPAWGGVDELQGETRGSEGLEPGQGRELESEGGEGGEEGYDQKGETLRVGEAKDTSECASEGARREESEEEMVVVEEEEVGGSGEEESGGGVGATDELRRRTQKDDDGGRSSSGSDSLEGKEGVGGTFSEGGDNSQDAGEIENARSEGPGELGAGTAAPSMEGEGDEHVAKGGSLPESVDGEIDDAGGDTADWAEESSGGDGDSDSIDGEDGAEEWDGDGEGSETEVRLGGPGELVEKLDGKKEDSQATRGGALFDSEDANGVGREEGSDESTEDEDGADETEELEEADGGGTESDGGDIEPEDAGSRTAGSYNRGDDGGAEGGEEDGGEQGSEDGAGEFEGEQRGAEEGAESDTGTEEDSTTSGMERWLETQEREPIPTAGVPPRKTLDQILEEGLDEIDENDEDKAEEALARRLQEHQDLGRRWVSSAMDAAGSQRTKKQLLKIVLLGYTRCVISGGCAPGASPGRERLVVAGSVAAGLAGFVCQRLKQRIQDTDFGKAPDVEIETVSPLGFVLGKKTSFRRVSAREHDLACLQSTARWGVALFALGAVLSLMLRAGDPLFILATLALSRFLAEPVFFVHAMSKSGRAVTARRPFVPPSFLNALLGSPHSPAASPTGASSRGRSEKGDKGG